jgi:hypothetical protein
MQNSDGQMSSDKHIYSDEPMSVNRPPSSRLHEISDVQKGQRDFFFLQFLKTDGT